MKIKGTFRMVMLCGLTLAFSTGCGFFPGILHNGSRSVSSSSVEYSYVEETEPTEDEELEQAIEIVTNYLHEIDNTRFVINGDSGEEGILFRFTDITNESCKFTWDSYVVMDYNLGINERFQINDGLYGEKVCLYKPLYGDRGQLESIMLDGVTMTVYSAWADGTPFSHDYIFRILLNLERKTCQLCMTRGTVGLTTGDYRYNKMPMQDLYDWMRDYMWLEFASGAAKDYNGNDIVLPEPDTSYERIFSLDDHLYKVFDDHMTWAEAEACCEAAGGHLATIGSKKEQNLITESIKVSDVENMWIGGYYSEADDEWHWIDGTDWSYTNWDELQPDNYTGDEYYLRLKNRDTEYEYWNAHDGKWNDTANEADGWEPFTDAPLRSFGYICEWDSIDSVIEE